MMFLPVLLSVDAWAGGPPAAITVGSHLACRHEPQCLATAAPQPPQPPQPLTRRATASRMQLENPLARIFGGGKKKDEEAGALSQGLDSVLANAPLPFKLAGQLLKPLAGALETALAESQGDAESLLDQARAALHADPRVADLLGTNTEPGGVFSSSSSNINGQRVLVLQFQVGSSGATGTARGTASPNGALQLEGLRLNAAGATLDVQSVGGGGGGRGGGGAADGIIDVEAS